MLLALAKGIAQRAHEARVSGLKADGMSETAADQGYTLSHLLDGRWSAEARAGDRKFWGGLAAAIVLHSLLLIGANASKPRAIGDPSGAEDAFSVDLITEADLNSRSAVADTAGNAPGPPAPPPQAPSPPQPQAVPQTEPPPAAKSETPPETPAPPEAKAETKPEVPPEPAAAPKTAPQPETKEAIKPPVAEDIPDVMKLQEAGIASEKKTQEPKPEELQTAKLPESFADPLPETLPQTPPAKQQAPAKPVQKPAEKKTAKLDLSMPAPSMAAPPSTSGGAAGMERPPGITRSGANDDFARGVIRALQRTMPQLSNTRGRVTVRIVLNETGNLADVKVVRPSDIAGLDQSVMFATRQSSYPLPPPNSKDVDRIFVVTYIYR